MPRLGRLGGRLVLATVGTSLVAVALVAAVDGAAIGIEFDRYSRQRQDDRAAQVVASLAAAYEARGGWAAADLDAPQQLAAAAGATLAVEDASGASVAVTPRFDMPHGSRMGPMGQMRGATDVARGPERREPIVVGGRVVGTAVLSFPATDLPAERAVRDALARAQWTAAAIAALVALALGLFFARLVSRPVAALASATDALARGERGARVRELPADELGDLGRGFNRMAESLEREDDLRRRVVADVAHELRTPLTSIQAHLEALRDGVIEPDAPTLASLHDEAAHLGRLVADLETLARAEAAGFVLERRAIDLADVVRDVASELADAFREKHVRLDLALRPAGALADEDRVAQIARNLVSNALKFTPAGGDVRVATGAEDGRAVLEVSDTGVGMTEDEAARAFDRFWRAPAARGIAGSGIGLTIARELAVAHGGGIRVTSAPGRGSTFRVLLPAR